MTVWLTADWHLGEDRFSLIGRPFKSVEEHIDFIVERHNSLVSDDDELIVIGDAVYQKAPQYIEHVKRFNASKKTLIRGNHDRAINEETLLKYFDVVIPEGEGLLMTFQGIPCWLTHYPSQGKQDAFNLVGHIHSTWKYQLNMLNVGVDVNHFYPVSGDTMSFHFDAISSYYDKDVWIAYSEINASHYGTRGKKTSYFTRDN